MEECRRMSRAEVGIFVIFLYMVFLVYKYIGMASI